MIELFLCIFMIVINVSSLALQIQRFISYLIILYKLFFIFYYFVKEILYVLSILIVFLIFFSIEFNRTWHIFSIVFNWILKKKYSKNWEWSEVKIQQDKRSIFWNIWMSASEKNETWTDLFTWKYLCSQLKTASFMFYDDWWTYFENATNRCF